MKMLKLVSIIIPVYNAKRYIENCVFSILEQTYSNIEIILIDDGSTDGSADICDSYQNYNGVKVIHQKNRGVSAARNRGIECARGEYVIFIDADDYVEKDYVLALVCSIQKYESQMAFCDFCITSEGKKEKKIKQHASCDEFIVRDNRFNFCKNHFASAVCGKVFVKDVLGNIRFSETLRIGEDSLFMAQYLKQIKSVSYTRNTLYYYQSNNDSVMHESFSEKKLDELEAWKRIEQLYIDEKYVSTTCRIRYLKVCKRIGTMLHKQNIKDKEKWKPYCKIIRSNWKIVVCGDDYFWEKVKLILFAFFPKVHYWFFEIKNK